MISVITRAFWVVPVYIQTRENMKDRNIPFGPRPISPAPSARAGCCCCYDIISIICLFSTGAGESTTDHLDLLDDNPLDQEDGFGSGHHNHQQLQQSTQNHRRDPPSSWQEQGGRGGGERNSSNPWYNDDGNGHDASAQWSRPGNGERRGFVENWHTDGEGGEGRAWKHEDLKQLLQVLTLHFCVPLHPLC